MDQAPPRTTTHTRRAILIPNITTFPSESMRRYATELEGGLRKVAGPEWEFEAMRCAPDPRLSDAWGGRRARFVTYPAQIRATWGDLYHILDHSHASLAYATPPSRSVLTCHDIIPLLAAKGILEMPTGRLTRYTFPMRLRAMDRCRALIAGSEATKRNMVEYGKISPDKITVVYYGVNPLFSAKPESRTEERHTILARHRLPEDARVILHVSSPMRYKNTPAVLRLLQGLRAQKALGDKVYLIRISAAFFPDEEQLIDRLGIRERVIHAGKVDDALLAAYYRAADLFIFPSLYEGFGWPPLEAMASGTPVITSNLASLPEVVGEAGITLSPTDDAGFLAAAVGLLTNEERRRAVAERCLARAASFTWERCGRDTLAVYQRLIEKN